MITTELIARAICKYGSCKECTEDCVDYRAAQRVMKAIEAEATEEETKEGFDRETEEDEV